MHGILLVLVVAAFLTISCHGKDVPVISANFIVDTKEVDGDISGTGTEVVAQTIAQDIDLRRSNMIARGSLVFGALQQIRRCDLHPSGWYIQASGVQATKPSTWECTNSTITRAGEMPQNCQYSSFWSMPPMKYEGVFEVNGQSCDKWSYVLDDSGSVYGFWTVEDEAIPVATGRTSNPSNPTQLYTIFFSNFVPGSPPDEVFMPQEGVVCPPASDPTTTKMSNSDNSMKMKDMLLRAAARRV